MITDHEDPRRWEQHPDYLTDEEIQYEADEAAHRADHDNKCQREYELDD